MNMSLSGCRRKYELSRHHAWAGTAFLSVLLAARLLFPVPDEIVLPFASLLIIYILTALFFTYKYRKGLSAEMPVVSKDAEKKRLGEEVEKKRLKLEKKKIKAELKAKKKIGKNL
jgi:hypothetical protein